MWSQILLLIAVIMSDIVSATALDEGGGGGGGDGSGGKSTIVLLKKRKKRGSLRNKAKEENEYDEGDEEEGAVSIADKMAELKSDQATRTKRQKVISTLDISGLGGKDDGPVAEKSMKEMMGSQFAAQESQQYGGAISHENLLESYIKDRTGHNEIAKAEVELSEEELLYRVPLHIKEMEGRSKSSDAAKDEAENSKGQVLSVSTGISEVALPQTYKLTNIIATEEARRKKEEDKKSLWELNKIKAKQKTLCLGTTAVSYMKKQQQDDRKAQYAAAEAAKREAIQKEKSVNRGVYAKLAESKQQDAGRVNHKQPYFEKSTDDATVGRFCKNQRRLNR